ncbi:unnamed protein product [Linum trigynum]|uniref:Uncharacterized protein n=1 Tax=Linum trigynum TaxID=586398 RepID=A0AAV2EB51_9ROSI
MVNKRRTSGAVIRAALKRTRKEGPVAVHLGLSVSASVDYHQVMSSFEQETKSFKFPQAEGFMCEINYEAEILEKVMDIGGEYHITAPETLGHQLTIVK